jgi:glutamine synthetase
LATATDTKTLTVAEGGFIDRHELWDDAQRAAAGEVLEAITERGLKRVRVGWGDQHGIIRGKTLTIPEFVRAMSDGKDFQLVTTIFDTTNHPIVPPFGAGNFAGAPELTGLPDGILVPDPTTFRTIPWVQDTGWVLCDAYFTSGRPLPFSTRALLRRTLEGLRELGYEYKAGLEIEFYVMRLEDPSLAPEQCGWPPDPPVVSGLSHGFQYLTESRGDEVHDLLSTLEENTLALGLPLLTIEDEWGPGQIEFTFAPQPGLDAGDHALLFKGAIKQICRRLGYHATFMARPAFPDFFSTGWHVHQSLSAVDGSTDNSFATSNGERLSDVARHWLAGLLEHAVAGSVFTTPTVTGFKRYRPDSFAPDRVAWAYENRGALLRVIGEAGSSATHIENRVGDPAANPYLYLASQVAAGTDGLRRRLDPGPPVEEPYKLVDAVPLPKSLMEAVNALRGDAFFKDAFGESFVDYLLRIKQFEIDRFLEHVTDWEHREYFEMY